MRLVLVHVTGDVSAGDLQGMGHPDAVQTCRQAELLWK